MSKEGRDSLTTSKPELSGFAGSEGRTLNGDTHNGKAPSNGAHPNSGRAESRITQYQALFDNAPVGYFILDREGIILDANSTATKQVRTGLEALRGTSFEQYLSPNECRQFGEHMRKVFSAAGTHTCELELQSSNGAKRCLQLQTAADPTDSEDRICYTVTSDVTERRKREDSERFLADANAKLGQSLDYHTTLAQLARMCVPYLGDWCTVFIIERDGSIQRLATAHADPAKEQIVQELQHRYPPGRDNHFAIPILQGEMVLIPDLDDKKIQATTQNEEHLDLVRRLGPTSMMIIPLTLRGRVLGALSLMSTGVHAPYNMDDVDLAMRLANRAAMPVENARLFLEAQEAVKARDEFLSIASHELRTPLTSLNLQVQGLLKSIQIEGLRHMPQDRVKRRLEGANEQVQRMVTLVNRLLDVSRITAGRIELEPEEINLVGLVGEVLDRFDVELRVAGCTLTLDILDHPIVCADRFRLDQVITNLVSNAIKYGKGGPINVTADCLDDKAILIVEDRGIGISPENLERIFERFERATGGTSITGLGLGLYISKRLIEAMGGRIDVTSKVDFGSKFTVELPIPQ